MASCVPDNFWHRGQSDYLHSGRGYRGFPSLLRGKGIRQRGMLNIGGIGLEIPLAYPSRGGMKAGGGGGFTEPAKGQGTLAGGQRKWNGEKRVARNSFWTTREFGRVLSGQRFPCHTLAPRASLTFRAANRKGQSPHFFFLRRTYGGVCNSGTLQDLDWEDPPHEQYPGVFSKANGGGSRNPPQHVAGRYGKKRADARRHTL